MILNKNNQKNKAKNMHMHEQRISKLCEYYGLSEKEASSALDVLGNLRYGYTTEVAERAKRKYGLDVSTQTVRHVKNLTLANPILFNLIIDLAVEFLDSGKSIRQTLKTI